MIVHVRIATLTVDLVCWSVPVNRDRAAIVELHLQHKMLQRL